jgi:Sec-independent protein translocase protein TatA
MLGSGGLLRPGGPIQFAFYLVLGLVGAVVFGYARRMSEKISQAQNVERARQREIDKLKEELANGQQDEPAEPKTQKAKLDDMLKERQ